tara:strand:+ start:114 stop:749 length:636 start_codon:yes stop_codon:yes gene_type:complete
MTALTDSLQIAYQEGFDTAKEGLKISMADPLPHPAKDTPQRPNPNSPPSSPWLPGKSPAPSRDDKLAGMPPDLNTPWLPGGQKTDGIPNITNPKLKKKLQEKKGIKGTDAELFPLAQGRDGLDQGTINKYRKMWQKHHNPDDPYTIPPDKLPAVQDIVIFERWPQADASALTNTLSPYQDPRTGSLRNSGLSNDEKRKLLIRGAEAFKQKA